MAYPNGDPGVARSFGLEVDGIEIKSITECTGLKLEQDVVEVKENTADGKYVIRKLPGAWKVPDITFKRGLTGNNSFEKWIKDSRFGKMGDVRKGGAVIVYDFEGTAVKRFKLTNCWPKSYEVTALKAGDTSMLTETLVVVCDTLEVE